MKAIAGGIATRCPDTNLTSAAFSRILCNLAAVNCCATQRKIPKVTATVPKEDCTQFARLSRVAVELLLFRG
jgi:hypothetical protein